MNTNRKMLFSVRGSFFFPGRAVTLGEGHWCGLGEDLGCGLRRFEVGREINQRSFTVGFREPLFLQLEVPDTQTMVDFHLTRDGPGLGWGFALRPYNSRLIRTYVTTFRLATFRASITRSISSSTR